MNGHIGHSDDATAWVAASAAHSETNIASSCAVECVGKKFEKQILLINNNVNDNHINEYQSNEIKLRRHYPENAD